MSEISLHDVLKAEKEAGERIKLAHQQADEIRKAAEKRIAGLDTEVNARIDAKRRERMERVAKEIAEDHKARHGRGGQGDRRLGRPGTTSAARPSSRRLWAF